MQRVPASRSGAAARARPTAVRLALALALLGSPARALDPRLAITQYVHDVWQAEQGLPQSSVYTTVQTRDGYLWLATQEGLVRFDGARFVVFDRRNTRELGNHFILSLHEDRAGRLWIGTGEGVVRYENGTFTRFGVAEGAPAGQVKSLLEDRSGRLWAGSLGGGLARLSGARFVREPGVEALGTRRVQALVEDRNGVLWIGTEAGLGRFSQGKLTLLSTADGLTHPDINALYEGRDGALWIGTTGGGLNRMKDGRITAFTTEQGLSNDAITAIIEDRDGNLWVGARGGVNRLYEGRFTAFTTREGLSAEFVFSLMEDREGGLWIGTGGGGLNRLRDSRLIPLGTREGLTNNFVRSFHEGRDGTLWIGTDGGGVNRLKDGKLTALTTKQGLSNDFVERVFEDSSGVLWIGTSGGGLNRFKDGRLTVFTTRQGLANDYVASICEGTNQSLWIGTRGGLSHLKDGRIRSLTTKDGLSNDIVRAVHQDRAGVVWIGTEGGGLNRLESGRITVLSPGDGLSSRNIVSIREDGSGALWIGTRGGGLMRLRDGRLKSVGSAEGLFDDSALAVVEDDQGWIWMTSNRGLFRASKREIEEVMEGRRPRLETIAYGTGDGMRSAEGNGSSSSGVKLRDGRMWFGTIAGAVMVDPKRLRQNTVAPEVHIEEVLVDGQEVDPKIAARLPPGPRTIEFHYTAISLAAPSRLAFRYKLEDYDADWIEAGIRRVAYYTGVPHGQYRFRIIAANEDGLWNEEGDSLVLQVDPRLQERPWFRFSLILVAGAMLYGGHRLRVVQLRARERELVAVVEERTHNLKVEKERTEAALKDAQQARAEAEAANLAKSAFLATMSHELRTPLNAVLGFTQLMGRKKARDEEDREHLGIIGRSGEHLLDLINDVLSLSKIEAGTVSLSPTAFELRPMLQGLIRMLGARAGAKGLKLTLDCADSAPEAVIGDEGKLRQILINLLSNAVKFTDRGEVSLRAEWRQGDARFTVVDTGPGLTPGEAGRLFQPFIQTDAGRRSGEGTGLGLSISRSFARLMGGDIEVSSEPGRGSTFVVTLPLPKADAETMARQRAERMRVVGLAPGQNSKCILVVDDVRENRLLLSRQLTSIGLTVIEAADGRQAIERWSEGQPDLILMDVHMPVMDGLAATRAIRAAEGQRPLVPRVKIIALSASVLDDERDGIRTAGCDDFLPKPFREGALFEKLAQLLGLQLVFEPNAPLAPSAEDEAKVRSALTAERLARLPPVLLESLRDGVSVGDDQAVQRAVDEIRGEDPELGEALGRTLREFQFDRLLELVKQASS